MTMPETELRSPLRELLSELTPTVFICALILVGFILVVIFAPLIAPYGEGEILTNDSFALQGSEGKAHFYWAVIFWVAIFSRAWSTVRVLPCP